MPSATPTRPWQAWYSHRRWQERRRFQLASHPLCVMCSKNGNVVAASVADHVVPHRGDYKLFWFGELQSLCASCHNGTKQQLEQKGFVRDIGTDGWPVCENHPANKGGGGMTKNRARPQRKIAS